MNATFGSLRCAFLSPKAYPNAGFASLRVHIHGDQVGRVIGRRGAHIRELQVS